MFFLGRNSFYVQLFLGITLARGIDYSPTSFLISTTGITISILFYLSITFQSLLETLLASTTSTKARTILRGHIRTASNSLNIYQTKTKNKIKNDDQKQVFRSSIRTIKPSHKRNLSDVLFSAYSTWSPLSRQSSSSSPKFSSSSSTTNLVASSPTLSSSLDHSTITGSQRSPSAISDNSSSTSSSTSSLPSLEDSDMSDDDITPEERARFARASRQVRKTRPRTAHLRVPGDGSPLLSRSTSSSSNGRSSSSTTSSGLNRSGSITTAFSRIRSTLSRVASSRTTLSNLLSGSTTTTTPIKLEDLSQAQVERLIRFQALWRGHRSRVIFRKHRIRALVAEEIVSTERTYVEALEFCYKEYQQPLEKLAQKPSKALLTNEQIKSIFSHLQVIMNYNAMLLSQLQSRVDHWTIESTLGDVFISKTILPFFAVYRAYVTAFDQSSEDLTEACKKSKSLEKWLRKRAADPRAKGQGLESFLIMPIQRIPRYVLLLAEMLKRTTEDHPDYENVATALEKMKEIARRVDDTKLNNDNFKEVVRIQKHLSGYSRLVQTHRLFVASGSLSELTGSSGNSSKTYHMFLFNDLLLFAKPEYFNKKKFNYVKSIPVRGIRSVDQVQGSPNRWTVTWKDVKEHEEEGEEETKNDDNNQLKVSRYQVESAGDAKAWMNHIQNVIDTYASAEPIRKRSNVGRL